MRLGYACVNITLGQKTRGLRLATLRERGLAYLQAIVDANLDLLSAILEWNRAHNIEVFRITSDLVPFGSHDEVDLGQLDFARTARIPRLAAGMRLSMHPGQFTVISADGTVWEASRKELMYHADIMDILGIDGDIVIHGGGVYGDRRAASQRIVAHIAALPERVRRRLRLENDERSWAVSDLLPICEESGVPLVVDNLHHDLNGTQPLSALPWTRILATWQGRRPKLHYSEQDPDKQPGAHSAYVSAAAFRRFQESVPWDEYDVMLECKAKERALLRLREELACASC